MIAIAVVPRDRFSMFSRCLEAVYAYTDVPFNVIVVAGSVDAATCVQLRRLETQRDNMSVMLVDRLLMQGEARNLALRRIKERFVVILENDTIVHDHWLSPLLECMQEARAAVVAPLIVDRSGLRIHAAGGVFANGERDEEGAFRHEIGCMGISRARAPQQRLRVDYPETHCLLLDRQLLPGDELFEDVEPFDADLGLTLRKRGLAVLVEPRSVATYAAPPPWEVRDIPLFKFRWDARAWAARNRLFRQKWRVRYDPRSKRAAYRRQYLKLGLARWYPAKWTVGMANASVTTIRVMRSIASRVIGEKGVVPPAVELG